MSKLNTSTSEFGVVRPNIEDYHPSGSSQDSHGQHQRDIEAAAAIVDQDSFKRCSNSNNWSWNIYLFPFWCLGGVARYGFLFPLRVMVAATTPLLPFFLLVPLSAGGSSPYVSPTTLSQNYQNMLTTFKIFIYNPSKPFTFPDGPASLFYNSLLRSPFLTQTADEAHLFLVPFSPDTSTRSLARVVRELRNSYPYWNRTLGADHFFLSPNGIDYSSDRNSLELKKNSIQISVFPVVSGYFIPHKDITLPPLSTAPVAPFQKNSTTFSFLGHLKWDGKTKLNLVNELKLDTDFLVEEKLEKFRDSKFCLFLYHGDMSGIVEAMASGCVPVVIVDRPIQDLPLMDILRWSDTGLLVRGSAWRLKQLLLEVSEEKYAEMRKFCVAASKHLVWKEESEPMDAFHMVMYQLWLRRHAIRYARRELV